MTQTDQHVAKLQQVSSLANKADQCGVQFPENLPCVFTFIKNVSRSKVCGGLHHSLQLYFSTYLFLVAKYPTQLEFKTIQSSQITLTKMKN